VEADTGQLGLQLAAQQPPDLVILDLGLPDMEGQEVLRKLREWLAAPIVILSARDQESQKVQALDGGADDYVTKPFGIAELLARMRTALRHAASNTDVSPVI
jgi:two-component system KDP operon response regulator KdpE